MWILRVGRSVLRMPIVLVVVVVLGRFFVVRGRARGQLRPSVKHNRLGRRVSRGYVEGNAGVAVIAAEDVEHGASGDLGIVALLAQVTDHDGRGR